MNKSRRRQYLTSFTLVPTFLIHSANVDRMKLQLIELDLLDVIHESVVVLVQRRMAPICHNGRGISCAIDHPAHMVSHATMELLVPDSLCVTVIASNDRFELNVAHLSLCDRCVSCKFTANIVDCDLGCLKSLVGIVATAELDILDGLVSIKFA